MRTARSSFPPPLVIPAKGAAKAGNDGFKANGRNDDQIFKQSAAPTP